MMSDKVKKIIFVVVIFQVSHVYCMESNLRWTLRARRSSDSSAHDEFLQDIKEELFEGGGDIDERDSSGMTLLHEALRYGDGYDVVRLLLEGGADVKARDNKGWTPLHWAASENEETAATKEVTVRAFLSEAFSTKSPKAIKESKDKAEQILCAFGKLEESLKKLPLLILSKMPEHICNRKMLDAILPFVSDENLDSVIEACPDEWLMRSKRFRARMGGDEQAMKAIVDFRSKQTEPLLTIKSHSTIKPINFRPELGSADFKAEVRSLRLARLAAYLHKSEEIKI